MLARTLGRTLDELGRTMSLAEFVEHWDDYIRSPWGDRRNDIQAALVCETVANHAGMTRKQPAKLSDYLLRFEPASQAAPDEPDPIEHFKQFQR